MTDRPSPRMSRRQFLQMSALGALGLFLEACGRRSPTLTPTAPPTPQPASPDSPATVATTTSAAEALSPTPACGDDDEPTLAQTAGPFFTPNSPERTSLREAGMAGTPFVLTGQVLFTDCRPAAGALLDFWHSDDAGLYDNEGFRLRGHQFADDEGRFTLETIVPGLYPGRTRHFHVKVQAPNGPVLTTQLYFPDEPDNQTDFIFHPDLVMAVARADEGLDGAFNFVLSG